MSLPDELLSDILTPALKVSEELCPNLETITGLRMGAAISRDTFLALPSSLRGARVTLCSENRRPIDIPIATLARFTELRILELTHHPGIPLLSRFDNLHTLGLGKGCEPSVYLALSKMGLPSLRYLTVRWERFGAIKDTLAQFLRCHGKTLVEMVVPPLSLELPKQTVTFELGDSYDPYFLCCDTPHKSLRKITVCSLDRTEYSSAIYVFYLSLPAYSIAYSALESIDFDKFPALQEIHLDWLCWPRSEQETSGNRWVKLAESLLERNMRMTDRDGNHWTPRVKKMKSNYADDRSLISFGSGSANYRARYAYQFICFRDAPARV
ncbi:hypothetical protein C8R43DRAFT_1140562 [Mycena crocata]|nr:hypothetical protein C8R43DRAFT_1140562 [Mycena crocata]